MRSVILRSTSATSTFQVSGSQSAKTGVRPFQRAEWPVAKKVKLGMMISPVTPKAAQRHHQAAGAAGHGDGSA